MGDIKEEYPEHEFVVSCLKLGLTTLDLEKFSYIEVMKIQYSFISSKENKTNNIYKKASQADIDKLLG